MATLPCSQRPDVGRPSKIINVHSHFNLRHRFASFLQFICRLALLLVALLESFGTAGARQSSAPGTIRPMLRLDEACKSVTVQHGAHRAVVDPCVGVCVCLCLVWCGHSSRALFVLLSLILTLLLALVRHAILDCSFPAIENRPHSAQPLPSLLPSRLLGNSKARQGTPKGSRFHWPTRQTRRT